MRARWTFAALAVVITVGAATAIAAAGPAGAEQTVAAKTHVGLKNGEYLPRVADEKKRKTADFELDAKAKGTRLVFPTGGSCMPSAQAIAAGIPPYINLTFHVAHATTVSSKGKFSYSGNITLTPEDTQSGISYTTHLTFAGQFVLGKKITTGKTIAVRGTFSAPTLCATTTLNKFADVYEPPGT